MISIFPSSIRLSIIAYISGNKASCLANGMSSKVVNDEKAEVLSSSERNDDVADDNSSICCLFSFSYLCLSPTLFRNCVSSFSLEIVDRILWEGITGFP